MIRIFYFAILILAANSVWAANNTDIKFGFAEVDITPAIGVKQGIWKRPPIQAIHDKLYVRCLAVKDHNGRTLLIASADLIFIFWNNTNGVSKHCKQKYNINPSDILFNGSHTHNSPRSTRGKYGDFVTQKMIECVDKAIANCKTDGYLVYAKTKSEIGVSRRHPYTKNGKTLMAFSPYIDGKIDKTLNILALYDNKNKLNTIVWVYPCHSTFFTQYIDKKVQASSDFSFAIRKIMKKELGENVNVIFLQGFGGDIKPRSISDKRDKKNLPIFTSDPGSAGMCEFGKKYGLEITSFIKSIKRRKVPVEFKSAADTFTLIYQTRGPVWKNKLKTETQLKKLIESSGISSTKRKNYKNQLKKGWYLGGKPTAIFYYQKISINDNMQILGISGEPTSGVARLLYGTFKNKENILVGYLQAGTYICDEEQQKEGVGPYSGPEVKDFGPELDETIINSFKNLKAK